MNRVEANRSKNDYQEEYTKLVEEQGGTFVDYLDVFPILTRTPEEKKQADKDYRTMEEIKKEVKEIKKEQDGAPW